MKNRLTRFVYDRLPDGPRMLAKRIYRRYRRSLIALRWLPKNIAWHLRIIKPQNINLHNLNKFEWRFFSQNGEDGIIDAIFRIIGTTNRFCVEFGVQNGRECNTRFLIERRFWNYLLMDSASSLPSNIRQEFITAENVNQVFQRHGVPKEFDLLSIDIDSNDYWVWKALTEFSPRVVVIEYNASIPAEESRTIPYDPDAVWDGTTYFGASLLALKNLGEAKGYELITCDSRGVNAFFLRRDVLPDDYRSKEIHEIYRPPRYGKKWGRNIRGHRPSERHLMEI
jgi:hypothetical protein